MSTISDIIAAATDAEQVVAALAPLVTAAVPAAGGALTITAEVIEGFEAFAKWIAAQSSLSAAAANAATEATIASVEAEADAKVGPKP